MLKKMQAFAIMVLLLLAGFGVIYLIFSKSELTLLLCSGWYVFVWCLSVSISRRIKPPEDGEKKD